MRNFYFIIGFLCIGDFLCCQTMGGYRINGYLQSTAHPDGCNPDYVTGPPDDSMWVNLHKGQFIEGTFNCLVTNRPGYDLMIETAYNYDSYNIYLQLRSGVYSSIGIHPKSFPWINLTEWHANNNAYYYDDECQKQDNSEIISRIVLFNFEDFSLTDNDTVIGIKIEFMGTNDDLAGVYIINGCSNVMLPKDTIVCKGDSLILYASISEGRCQWQDSSVKERFIVTEPGKYWVKRTTPCGISSDTIQVYFSDLTQIELGNDTIICEGNRLTFDLTFLDCYLLWQDNSSSPTYMIENNGTYWLSASAGSCKFTDTLKVIKVKINLKADTTVCDEKPFVIGSEIPNASYVWQDGSQLPFYQPVITGLYWVNVQLKGCSSEDSVNVVVRECIVKIEMPNVFSPNNDDVNEIFRPCTLKGSPRADLFIYNRWGQMLFYTDNLIKGWDGKVGGNDCAEGGYFWIVQYDDENSQKQFSKGNLQLVR